METGLQIHLNNTSPFHFKRTRLNHLFMEAIKYPVVTVCAGSGYGKTSAVHDFVQETPVKTIWIQLSERDNIASRVWEKFTNSISQLNAPFAKAITKLGFPDTRDKKNQYFTLIRAFLDMEPLIMVWDDYHLIEDPAILRFVENTIVYFSPGTSVFFISRSTPKINLAAYISRGQLFSINEDELRFTEDELFQYFRMQEINLLPNELREIMEDTEGWAFAINLIAQSYKRAPNYGGYLRSAMKTNIFQLIETESWGGISLELQNFLICISLIDHLSIDLISILAKGNEGLIAEMEQQNAYIRRDNYINAYLIHHLFLEFLCQKQSSISEKDRYETYKIAGDWCNKNGFKVDALTYFEKIAKYDSIVGIFFELPTKVPQDIAVYASQIFDRIPEDIYKKVDFLAVMQVRTMVSLGLWKETEKLLKHYENIFLQMPENDIFRNHSLGGLYYCWGIMRSLMCTTDDSYDFDEYFAKQDKYFTVSPVNPGSLSKYPVGAWASLVGSSRKGAPDEYNEAAKRAVKHTSHCFNGAMAGIDDLVEGELKYFQGDLRTAEPFFIRALENARKHKQFEIVNRALNYSMRIAVAQGNYVKADRAIKEMEAQLGENEYSNRFINFDIGQGGFYYLLGFPEKIPGWLKENFSPYSHAYFIENFGNQIKARYFYRSNNFPVLLAYMQEQKQRETVLYGRVEMLAMEACVHYKLKNKKEALKVLAEAHEMAMPNNLIMPFIQLNRDMRTLTASALKDSSCKIPKKWLETIQHKAASFAKRQAHVITEYKQANYIETDVSLSTREREILSDLSYGLSRTEIAESRSISINTVKMVINFIYSKLGAQNLAGLIRIATERKMI